MTMHEEKHLECAAAFALGALSGDELREFELHLKSGCTTCSREVASLAEAANALPAMLPIVRVSPDLKERILFAARLANVAKEELRETMEPTTSIESVQEKPAEEVQPRRSWFTVGIAFAAVVMVVGFAAYIATMLEKVNQQYTFILHQSDSLSAQHDRLTELAAKLGRNATIVNLLEARHLELALLDGLKSNPSGFGKIIWDPVNRVAIVQVANLPLPPSDKEYHVWVIKGEKQISVGVVDIRGEMESVISVQPIEVSGIMDINAFTVTLEPKGGVTQPTGEIYLFGRLAKK